MLAISSSIGIYLYDAETLEELKFIDVKTSWDVAFHPDGSMLATADNSANQYNLRLWDVETGKLIKTLEGHSHKVLSIAFSPDGQILASGSADGSVRLWDVHSGELLHVLGGYSYPSVSVRSVAFDPASQILASGGSDNVIRLWDTNTGTLMSQLNYHIDTVTHISFSPKITTDMQKNALTA
jgi:WD40 repeat protein